MKTRLVCASLALSLLLACRGDAPTSPTKDALERTVTDWLRRLDHPAEMRPLVGRHLPAEDQIEVHVKLKLPSCRGACELDALGRVKTDHADDLFREITREVGFNERFQLFLVVDGECRRLNLAARRTGAWSERWEPLCRMVDLPLIKLPGPAAGRYWLDDVETEIHGKFSSLGQTVTTTLKEERRIKLRVELSRQQAQVVRGSWEILEILVVLLQGEGGAQLSLSVDGRYAGGFRRPADDQFVDMQATHPLEIEQFAGRLRDGLERRLRPGDR